ncbi:MAG: ribonuclease III [Acidimicrobiales bacterium]|nr:ribonuclease III [Acidimicrobiales bacterium]
MTPLTMSSPDSTEPPLHDLLAALADRVGHCFADLRHLELAVTHRSFCAENTGVESNERLEFLGDSVLGLIVTDELYRRYPDAPEGELAKARAALVNSPTLAELAAAVQIGDALRLGRGEDASGGRAKPSILADAMEAVIGAVYLDGGLDAARTFVLPALEPHMTATEADGPGANDFKTRLQERVAALGLEPPQYEIEAEGPDHDKRFHATVHIGGEQRGHGSGTSKKQAEQAAAEAAIDRVEHELLVTTPAPREP